MRDAGRKQGTAMRDVEVLANPEEDTASRILHFCHNPPFQNCTDSRPHFYPDTHDFLHSVDGDTRIQYALEGRKIQEQDIRGLDRLERGANENVAASLIDVRLSEI